MPCFHVVFAEAPAIPAEELGKFLRHYHPELATAAVDDSRMIRWGPHAVELEVQARPLEPAVWQVCLQAALLPPEVKNDARRHGGYARLSYSGAAADRLEQFVAVAAVAGVLAEFGGIVVIHEAARTAIFAAELLPDDPGEDMLIVLRTLPIPYLYGGFAKLTLSDRPGVWMRTFANHLLGLPDLAYAAAGHAEGQATFVMFSALLRYLRESGAVLRPGESLQIDDAVLTLREPEEAEWWLDSPGPMRVLERVTV